jgi:hypothetical protein
MRRCEYMRRGSGRRGSRGVLSYLLHGRYSGVLLGALYARVFEFEGILLRRLVV